MTRGSNGEHHVSYGVVEIPNEDENNVRRKSDTKYARKMSRYGIHFCFFYSHFYLFLEKRPTTSKKGSFKL